MQSSYLYVALVAVGYLALTGAVLYLVPSPWHLVVSAVILLKGVQFLFTIRRATKLGAGRRPPAPPPEA